MGLMFIEYRGHTIVVKYDRRELVGSPQMMFYVTWFIKTNMERIDQEICQGV